MGGVILYLYFLFVGFLYSNTLFDKKDIYFKAWMGGIFGTLMLMSGIILPASIFDFTIVSHIILAVIVIVPYIVLKAAKQDKKLIDIKVKGAEEYMDTKIFLCLILPISFVIWVLMTNHILAPMDDGSYSSGQCTYGDLQMHLSFITSIAEQREFPPEYSLLAGTELNYPFFVDMLSSSLYLFGTPLRLSVLLPSYVISMLLVMGFYNLAYTLTKRKASAILATVFFFINGGFGFAYFLEGAKADSTVFTDIFNGYYTTPTNLNEKNIRWSNTICDMIIPQRTTMAGWCLIIPSIWLLLDALKSKSRKIFIVLGVIAGFMPMVHTHSFLALGMICAVLFFLYLSKEEDKKAYIINWVIFGGIIAIIAAPQLFFWTFRQTSGNESFLRYGFNWVNHNDTYFWFYLKNWGVVALFMLPAVINTSKDNKRLLLGCLFIFIVAEFILFQPNEYDNNKLFYIVYMIVLIIVCEWLVNIYDKLKGVKGRSYLAVIIIIAGTMSGALTIGREYISGGMYQTFSTDAIKMADYIKENTDKDAVFLTSTNHTNPVATLAGRTIYVGSSLYVYFHGMGNEFYERENNLKEAYKGSYEDMLTFCKENNIQYVYVGHAEKSTLSPNQDMLNKLEKVYSIGTEDLYRIE